MSNKNRTTLYVGVTNDIHRRILEHKAGVGASFTSRYLLSDLLFYEECDDITSAIVREKQIKRWHREWKWNLIKDENRALVDLASDCYTTEDIHGIQDHYRRDPETILRQAQQYVQGNARSKSWFFIMTVNQY
jgi:putative endonuclease